MEDGSSHEKTKLEILLEKIEQKLIDVFEYYHKNGLVESQNEFIGHNSTVILLIVRELENIIDKFNVEEGKDIYITQYSFSFKKVYAMKFHAIDIDYKFVKNSLDKIFELKMNLLNLIDEDPIEKKLKATTIDDIICPKEQDGYLLDIITNAFNSNFHKFFIDNYVHNFIKLKMDGKNIYTKEVLLNLKMAKYTAQIIIFIKLFIKFYNNEKPELLTKEEYIKGHQNMLNDEFALTNFLLFELRPYETKLTEDLTKDNEMALEALREIYHKLNEKIKQIENNIQKN